MRREPRQARLVFFWENFGPLHNDRLKATALLLGQEFRIIGLELSARSNEYEWPQQADQLYAKETLYPCPPKGNVLLRSFRLSTRLMALSQRYIFLCHYESPEVIFSAYILRAMGRKPVVMNCSKFDDKPRFVFSEYLKSFALKPYVAAISSPKRGSDYLRFLGIKDSTIFHGYNTVSVARIRQEADFGNAAPAPHKDRYFLIVARLVSKKNIELAIRAYAHYIVGAVNPRRLIICGAGPERKNLIILIESLQLTGQVEMRGHCGPEEVSSLLNNSLALILPSIIEQFGNVVLEAHALGIPTLVSTQVGAREMLVFTAQTGFFYESDNPIALATYMGRLAEDITLWNKMSEYCLENYQLIDAARFAESVRAIVC